MAETLKLSKRMIEIPINHNLHIIAATENRELKDQIKRMNDYMNELHRQILYLKIQLASKELEIKELKG